jgi:hypothetical protein
MNIRHLTSCFIVLALTVSVGAAAEEIYKWTDKDGNVQYEDRPSGDPSEELMQVSYNRTSRSAVDNRVQSQRESAIAREDARAEAKEAEQTAADERVSADEKAAKCLDYRQRMKTMLEAPRVYREDENGERSYLNDVARAEARQKAEEHIKATCDS